MRNEYIISDKTVVWDWDENVHNAADFPADNLYILGADGAEAWNMRDAVERKDTCVSLEIKDERIRFITFGGKNITFDVKNMKIISVMTVK